ncbi:MAG: hypothetical protein JJU37_05005 [Balneolaceae bacterium]|nr:hypothetical protein [Balneolaceae bacterium]
MIQKAVHAELNDKQIQFGIKSAYPFRRFLQRYEKAGYIAVWYPWFYVSVSVEMDTYLKKGMIYNDLVAVDCLRPVKERVSSYPEALSSDLTGDTVLKSKIEEKEASDEAVDLIKGIVLSRNKLLKDYEVQAKSCRLYYLKTFVVKFKDRSVNEWIYIDEHFEASAKLQSRPEVLSYIQKLNVD